MEVNEAIRMCAVTGAILLAALSILTLLAYPPDFDRF